MRSVAMLLVVLVLFATASSAQSLNVSVSGTVVWSGLGPVPNLQLEWTVGGLFLPIYRTWLTTDQNGWFSGKTQVLASQYSSSTVLTSMAVPGSATGVTLTGYSRGANAVFNITIPPPTVMINGAFQPPGTWSSLVASMPPSLVAHPNGSTTLATRHCRVITLPNAWKYGHIDNARRLDSDIGQYRSDILQATRIPAQSMTLNLVAHSLDGLVARAYIANHTGGTNQDLVDRCVTIGSPHVGTWWLESLPPSWPPFQSSPSLFQARPTWLITVFPGLLQGTYGATRFYLVGANRNLNPLEPEAIPGWPYDPNDDGVVSTYSATFPFQGARIAGTAFFPHAHYDMPGQQDVINQVVKWLQ